jgi:hypothetical protein
VGFVDHGANLRVGNFRTTQHHRTSLLSEALDEAVGNRRLNDQAATGAAFLTLIDGEGGQRPIERGVDIRIREDDVRTLSAKV